MENSNVGNRKAPEASSGCTPQTRRTRYGGAAPEVHPNRRPVPYAGIRAGEIIAPRFWELNTAHGYLCSMAASYDWLPGAQACEYLNDYIGGFYAFKDERHAISEYGTGAMIYDRINVLGKVALWGVVIEHEWGWRGEFAAIHSLDMIFDSRWLGPLWRQGELEQLRKRYGV